MVFDLSNCVFGGLGGSRTRVLKPYQIKSTRLLTFNFDLHRIVTIHLYFYTSIKLNHILLVWIRYHPTFLSYTLISPEGDDDLR